MIQCSLTIWDHGPEKISQWCKDQTIILAFFGTWHNCCRRCCYLESVCAVLLSFLTFHKAKYVWFTHMYHMTCFFFPSIKIWSLLIYLTTNSFCVHNFSQFLISFGLKLKHISQILSLHEYWMVRQAVLYEKKKMSSVGFLANLWAAMTKHPLCPGHMSALPLQSYKYVSVFWMAT